MLIVDAIATWLSLELAYLPRTAQTLVGMAILGGVVYLVIVWCQEIWRGAHRSSSTSSGVLFCGTMIAAVFLTFTASVTKYGLPIAAVFAATAFVVIAFVVALFGFFRGVVRDPGHDGTFKK